MIPIVIICYNNYKLVANMINQIENINENISYNDIWIINNKSSCKLTIDYLNKTYYKVINLDNNYGHNVWLNKFIYDELPEKFIVTDPDLKLNESLPKNYIDILINISEKFCAVRVGFAIDISEPELMFPYKFSDFKPEWINISTICKSQEQYWQKKLYYLNYELYNRPIDTTFLLFNKKYKNLNIHIRVANNFTCKHLPWYKDINILSRYQRYIMYNDSNDSSSIKYFELQYIKDCQISIVKKNDEIFLIDKNNYDKNTFWREMIKVWQPDLFYILDKYLNKNKQFLNFGDVNGIISLYASRNSNCVVNVEPNINNSDYDDLIKLFEINYCDVDIAIERKMTQIEKLVNKYKLNDLSLINLNLNRLEEILLREIYDYCKNNKIPLLVKFNYGLWENKDLNRFEFLNTYQKEKIYNYPECYILF